MKISLESKAVKELPSNEFYKLSTEERVKILDGLFEKLDESNLDSDILLEELWKLRGEV